MLETGKSCDHEHERKTEVDLDEWSTELRDKYEERPTCIEYLEMSPGVA